MLGGRGQGGTEGTKLLPSTRVSLKMKIKHKKETTNQILRKETYIREDRPSLVTRYVLVIVQEGAELHLRWAEKVVSVSVSVHSAMCYMCAHLFILLLLLLPEGVHKQQGAFVSVHAQKTASSAYRHAATYNTNIQV